MIEIKAVPGKLIMLGKQGENLAREVIFDVSGVRAEFGDGTFRLSAKRPGEADAYPATVTETGDTVVWALTGADTQNAGRGQCELAYYAGETRLKTWTYDTAIAKSLTGSPKTDPYDEFLDEVNRLAAEAAISQREAKNSENAAKNSEENAKASEDAAKTSEDNAAEYARAALAAESKSEQNAEYAASAATTAGQHAQNSATSATNAASSASAAETHEKGAKDAAAAAAKSAEGLADAVKRAKDAATSAQENAGKTAADREAVAEMKTAAQTAQGNAEKAATAAAGSATSAGESAAATATEKAAEIADSAAQIAKNTENIGKNATGIKTNATEIDLLRRENTELRAKTDALWKLSEGKSYDFVEDSAEAYSKAVPTGSRFAQVEKIGGKTVAWNQLRSPANFTYSSNGLTVTHTGLTTKIVGTFKLPSTEDKTIYLGAEMQINLIQGHKYILASVGGTLYGILPFGTNISVIYNDRTNAIFACATSGKGEWCFSPKNAAAVVDGTAVNEAITTYAIDLTQFFGSGNEPTTTSDPRIAEIIAYAQKYPAYNTGELVSAGVEDVEVQGANLVQLPDAISPGYTDTKKGLTFTVNADNSITVKGTATEDAYFNFRDLKPGLVNGIQSGMNSAITYGGYTIKDVVAQPFANATALYLVFSSGAVISKTYYPQFAHTTTLPAYSPYSLDTYPIPDAVKALPGYGWSAGNISNEIVRRADGWDYVQRVERHVADNPDKWRLGNSNIRKFFVTSVEKPALKLAGSSNFRMVCDRLMYVSYSYAEASKQPYTISFQSNATTLAAVFTDTDTDSLDTWQAWLQSLIDAGTPLTVYYAVATPITTDITDLMTGALPLMTTEQGGTITMHHALADDGLRLDVPNTVKYIRDLKEVASSGTE